MPGRLKVQDYTNDSCQKTKRAVNKEASQWPSAFQEGSLPVEMFPKNMTLWTLQAQLAEALSSSSVKRRGAQGSMAPKKGLPTPLLCGTESWTATKDQLALIAAEPLTGQSVGEICLSKGLTEQLHISTWPL